MPHPDRQPLENSITQAGILVALVVLVLILTLAASQSGLL